MKNFNKLNWYVLTAFVLIFNPFFLFLADLDQNVLPFSEQISDFTIGIFIGAAWFYALFRCAYLKPGIKFLLTTLITTVVLQYPGNIWLLISHIYAEESSQLFRLAALLMTGLVVYWYCCTLQLYKAHKRTHLIKNELYARAFADFEKVVTLEKLEMALEKWMRAEESFGAQDAVFEAYKVRKELLMSPR